MLPVYDEWRERWPTEIVGRDSGTAKKWLDTYFGLAGGKPYTGAAFERIARMNSDPNTIGTADLVAVSTLSVDIKGAAAIGILEADADGISSLLALIPTDADIVDVEASVLATGGPASQLWRLLRTYKDVGRTRTSKLIAAKRPRLIPIWDSFVQQATGLDTTDNWRQFRVVLEADDFAIWGWLGDLKAQHPGITTVVSRLRLLDVLLWMSVDSKRRS